jgi:hypothetical protein
MAGYKCAFFGDHTCPTRPPDQRCPKYATCQTRYRRLLDRAKRETVVADPDDEEPPDFRVYPAPARA